MIGRREFLTLLGGAAAAPSLLCSLRARSSRSGCGGLVCSCPQPRMIQSFRPG